MSLVVLRKRCHDSKYPGCSTVTAYFSVTSTVRGSRKNGINLKRAVTKDPDKASTENMVKEISTTEEKPAVGVAGGEAGAETAAQQSL